MQDESEALSPPTPEVVQRLVANHRRFLAFLDSRVGNRADAEEILQAAFVRGMEKGGALRDDESAVAWFYRLLRNAVTDHYRRRGSAQRGRERLEGEPEPVSDALLRAEACRCVVALLPTLSPDYADIVERIDVQEASLADAALALGISKNNAAVRVHRARQALKRQVERSCGTCATHGCFDCTCGSAKA